MEKFEFWPPQVEHGIIARAGFANIAEVSAVQLSSESFSSYVPYKNLLQNQLHLHLDIFTM